MIWTIIFWISVVIVLATSFFSFGSGGLVDNIMKRENDSYTGHINNFFDNFRIIYTYHRSGNLSKAERSALRLAIINFILSLISILIIILLFIFIPHVWG